MIYIVRHGETEKNRQKVLQGRSDVPLNQTGIEQAEALSGRMRGVSFDKVYSSPLSRAIETAKILAPGKEILTDDRLIEMDYGPYEGMSLLSPAPEVISFFRDFVHAPAPKGMESLASVVKRVGEFLEECCRTDKDVLISTHAIAMKGILEYLTPDSQGSYWSKYIGNCAVYATDYREGAFLVPFIN